MKNRLRNLYAPKLLVTAFSWIFLTGFFWDKADPGAVEAVSQYFQLVDCGDEQHYVFGQMEMFNFVVLYALDLGSNYQASDYLSFTEEDVSTIDSKNGIEKAYWWEFELKDVPARNILVLDQNDFYNHHAEKSEGWYSEEFKMWGYVKLVDGKWEVDMPIRPFQPWFGHWKNDPLRSCAIFGL